MADILLITEAEFKNLCPVSNNITITTPLKQSILNAQIRYVKSFCKELYDRIQTEINPGPPSVPITDLLPFIKQWLSYATMYTMLPFNYVKVRETGPVLQTGNSFENIDSTLFTYQRGEIAAAMEMFKQQVVEFIEENIDDYPEYKDCNDVCGCDEPKKYSNRFFNNI